MTDNVSATIVWSDIEIDLIVADYFEMLRKDILGESLNKAEHNRQLQGLVKRTRSSIEFKHQNISAILVEIGEPWLSGYAPMNNYQNALVDGVERYLESHSMPHSIIPKARENELSEDPELFIEQPPDRVGSVAERLTSLVRLIRKFDPAERDAKNRQLGKLGEELVFNSEKSKLISAGFLDLAKKVRWVSEVDGDGAGYDIRSYDLSGKERLIEVKTTSGGGTTPFYLSENERAFSVEQPNSFKILRLYNFNKKPRAFEIAPPLDNWLFLSPTNYKASFGVQK